MRTWLDFSSLQQGKVQCERWPAAVSQAKAAHSQLLPKKPLRKRPFPAALVSDSPLGPEGCAHSLSARDRHAETHSHVRRVRASQECFVGLTRETERKKLGIMVWGNNNATH